jgi:polyphosphate glucokinase
MNERVLCVDVGATSIKSQLFGEPGVGLDQRRKRTTPKPCTPSDLVSLIAQRCADVGARRVGVGFPGEVHEGVVVDAANLARRAGPGSPVEPSLYTRWTGYDLAQELQRITGAEIILANDAVMAARGCLVGPGIEMVITLGTGCGVALAHEGVIVGSIDVGNEELIEGSSFDELLGEFARHADELEWLTHLHLALDVLSAQYNVSVLHLAGGNAKRISPREFTSPDVTVIIERDDPALLGAWRSFFIASEVHGTTREHSGHDPQ